MDYLRGILITERNVFKLDTARYILKWNRIFRILNNRLGIKNLIYSLDGTTSFLNLGIQSDKSSDRSRNDQGIKEKSPKKRLTGGIFWLKIEVKLKEM